MSNATNTISKQGQVLLDALSVRLAGGRKKSLLSIEGYTLTARRFVLFLGNKSTFNRTDYDRYIAKRRSDGLSERSLRTEAFHVRKLAEANNIELKISKDDMPYTKEKPNQPTLMPNQIETLILNQYKYSNADRFYLMVSTVWAARREALSQIKKRDYDDRTFIIRGVHGGETVKHKIPDQLKPIFSETHIKEHTTDGLSLIWHRIVKIAGLELDKGYGWHSVRRTVNTVMRYVLPARGVDPSLWSEFTGWSTTAEGEAFFGSSMMAYYTHSEIMDDEFIHRLKILTGNTHGGDPYWKDASIYLVHPFLKVWEQAIKEHPIVKKKVSSPVPTHA